MSDGQGRVFVGAVRQRLVDEQMTRSATNDFEHLGARQPFLVEALDQAVTGALRGHSRAMQQVVLSAMSHSTFSTQLSRPLKASRKVLSSCSGVIET